MVYYPRTMNDVLTSKIGKVMLISYDRTTLGGKTYGEIRVSFKRAVTDRDDISICVACCFNGVVKNSVSKIPPSKAVQYLGVSDSFPSALEVFRILWCLHWIYRQLLRAIRSVR